MIKRIMISISVLVLLTLCVSTAFAFDVASHSPAANATVGDPDINITVEFDDDVDPATVTAANWILWTSGGQEGIAVSLDVDGRTVVINPAVSLVDGARYYLYGNQGIENVIGDEWSGYLFYGFDIGQTCDPILPDPCECGTATVADTCGGTQEVDCGSCQYAADECSANACIPPFADEKVVTFPGANFETAIREAIAKPSGDLTYGDVKDITVLNGNMDNIANITGLKYLVSMKYLYLQYNALSHISMSSIVESDGIGEGDLVLMQGNPMWCAGAQPAVTSILARGVNLVTDCILSDPPACVPDYDLVCGDLECGASTGFDPACPGAPIDCGGCIKSDGPWFEACQDNSCECAAPTSCENDASLCGAFVDECGDAQDCGVDNCQLFDTCTDNACVCDAPILDVVICAYAGAECGYVEHCAGLADCGADQPCLDANGCGSICSDEQTIATCGYKWDCGNVPTMCGDTDPCGNALACDCGCGYDCDVPTETCIPNGDVCTAYTCETTFYGGEACIDFLDADGFTAASAQALCLASTDEGFVPKFTSPDCAMQNPIFWRCYADGFPAPGDRYQIYAGAMPMWVCSSFIGETQYRPGPFWPPY